MMEMLKKDIKSHHLKVTTLVYMLRVCFVFFSHIGACVALIL